ncbi:hypothetical protein WN943_011085 [Citrus x changshan-huyou]
MALALIVSARKLRPHFQANTIIMLTNQPLRQIMQQLEVSRRLARISGVITRTWRLYVDGSSNQQGSGAGLILVNLEHTKISSALRLGFKTSNNETEYKALLASLRLTKEMGAEKLEIFKHTITQVSREEDSKADALARLATTTDAGLNGLILVEFLQYLSINRAGEKCATRFDESVIQLLEKNFLVNYLDHYITRQMLKTYAHPHTDGYGKISLERDKVMNSSKSVIPAAFVSFKTRWRPPVCAQIQRTRNPTLWLTDWAPEPHDVYWDNLAIPFETYYFCRIFLPDLLFHDSHRN